MTVYDYLTNELGITELGAEGGAIMNKSRCSCGEVQDCPECYKADSDVFPLCTGEVSTKEQCSDCLLFDGSSK